MDQEDILSRSVIVSGARMPIGELSGASVLWSQRIWERLRSRLHWSGQGLTRSKLTTCTWARSCKQGHRQLTARQAAVKAGIPLTTPPIHVTRTSL
jgi:acetyl-CoA C-acetyltransferase